MNKLKLFSLLRAIFCILNFLLLIHFSSVFGESFVVWLLLIFISLIMYVLLMIVPYFIFKINDIDRKKVNKKFVLYFLIITFIGGLIYGEFGNEYETAALIIPLVLFDFFILPLLYLFNNFIDSIYKKIVNRRIKK